MNELIKELKNNSQLSDKIKMEKYMKNKFSFYGVKAPCRKEIQKVFVSSTVSLSIEELKSLISDLHNYGIREVMYVAQDIALFNFKRIDYDFITFLVDLTLINSWWDNTDGYNACIKRYFMINQSELSSFIKKYSNSDNIWHKRISLICQLNFKGLHNRELVKLAIENTKDVDEFFVQKAIGWILRDISKYDVEFVCELLSGDFSKLVVKEATKNMRLV